VAGRNDAYLDLLASSEADKNALAEIRYLTEQAILTRDVFAATLTRVSLAAQALVLLDHESCRAAQVC
jgi:hypothetical protein